MIDFILLPTFLWLFLFKIDKGSSNKISTRGGGGTTIESAPPPPAPSAGETSRDVYNAQLEFFPKAQQLGYNMLTDPSTGLGPTTQAYEQVRQQLFPGEQAVREQLQTNILGNLQDPATQQAQQAQQLQMFEQLRSQFFPQEAQLREAGTQSVLQNLQGLGTPEQQLQQIQQLRSGIQPGEAPLTQQLGQQALSSLQSPTGLTPEQQMAQDAVRQRAIQAAQEAQRTRANLGGGLYGGRAQAAEQQDINNLLQSFAVEDIDRQERARQQAFANAQATSQQLRGYSEADLSRQQQQQQQAQQDALATAFGLRGQAEDDLNRAQTAQQNAIQAALPFLQILFPDVGITAPQFTSPVPSSNVQAQSNITARGQDIQNQQFQAQLAQQQAAQQAALQQSLFSGLGSALGGAAGGAFGLGGMFGQSL